MEIKVKLSPPSMPNFALAEGSPNTSFPIDKMTKEEAEAYGELMKQTFLEHWKKKKNNPSL